MAKKEITVTFKVVMPKKLPNVVRYMLGLPLIQPLITTKK